MASEVLLIISILVFGKLFHYCDAKPGLNPVVKTKLGWIEGLRDNDCNCSMFMGIPYARVNSSNPFGAAIPQETFQNVFQAHDDSARCPQIEEFNNTYTGTLDCLHINIYVPGATKPKTPLPVLVSIYGGNFTLGFAGRYIYGPQYLIRHDIIFVNFNYRVGPYGYMCLDSPEIPGNQGSKDQVLALKWIKDNIESFGGDSDQITVLGVSSGGVSADIHVLFKKENLFNKVILESGVAILPIYLQPEKDAPQRLASHLGVHVNNLNEAVSYLATVDPRKVITATSELNLYFGLCIEKQFQGIEAFIDESWLNKKPQKINDMTALIGYTKDEYLVLYAERPQCKFDNLNIFEKKLAYDFDIHHADFEGMLDIVKHFYIGDRNENDMNNRYEIAEFDSDFTYIHPIHRTINRYLASNMSKIYHYVFSYEGNRNFLKKRVHMKKPGVVHADELGYLFDISYFDDDVSVEDQLIIDRLTTLWANFVKYGNPTPETSALIPVLWKPITKDSSLNYMDINLIMKLKTRNYNRRMAFWDLFYKTNEKLQVLYKYDTR
ncbi:hypothetical protein ACJJTC_007505 [Scirpophaga incertulas]